MHSLKIIHIQNKPLPPGPTLPPPSPGLPPPTPRHHMAYTETEPLRGSTLTRMGTGATATPRAQGPAVGALPGTGESPSRPPIPPRRRPSRLAVPGVELEGWQRGPGEAGDPRGLWGERGTQATAQGDRGMVEGGGGGGEKRGVMEAKSITPILTPSPQRSFAPPNPVKPRGGTQPPGDGVAGGEGAAPVTGTAASPRPVYGRRRRRGSSFPPRSALGRGKKEAIWGG